MRHPVASENVTLPTLSPSLTGALSPAIGSAFISTVGSLPLKNRWCTSSPAQTASSG